MSESRVIISILSDKRVQDVETFIRDKNIMGKYIEVQCTKPEVAAIVTSLMGNMNKVIIINGIVVKSFDGNYTVGETVGWFADYTSIKF
jgi:hypothetical protein